MVAEKEKSAIRSYEQSSDSEQLEEIAHERHEVLREQLEHAERQHETRTTEQEAAEEAREFAKESEKEELPPPSSPAERRRGAPSKKQREATLKSQLKQVQNEMNTTDRILSKFIHSRPVESVSDAAASSVARPNALLSGSIAAFIGVTLCYFIAKYYGYQLSGFETIAAFIFGWIIGILYDYFSVMIRGHRKNR